MLVRVVPFTHIGKHPLGLFPGLLCRDLVGGVDLRPYQLSIDAPHGEVGLCRGGYPDAEASQHVIEVINAPLGRFVQPFNVRLGDMDYRHDAPLF